MNYVEFGRISMRIRINIIQTDPEAENPKCMHKKLKVAHSGCGACGSDGYAEILPHDLEAGGGPGSGVGLIISAATGTDGRGSAPAEDSRGEESRVSSEVLRTKQQMREA